MSGSFEDILPLLVLQCAISKSEWNGNDFHAFYPVWMYLLEKPGVLSLKSA